MPTISELFHSIDHDEIIAAVDHLYPNLPITTLENFRKCSHELREWPLCFTALSCEVVIRKSDDGDSHCDVVVVGRDIVSGSASGEYTSWSEWLAMGLVVKSELGEQPVANIAAHVLWEMTCSGFDKDLIQKKLQKLKFSAVGEGV